VRIQLNGKQSEVEEGHSVRTLLESLELHPGMVVVELNRDIVERDRYSDLPVQEGDVIELVHFVGGG
jgi:sulfur carrier protein